MAVLPIVIASLLGADPVRFQRHLIDNFPAGYQVAVADINGVQQTAEAVNREGASGADPPAGQPLLAGCQGRVRRSQTVHRERRWGMLRRSWPDALPCNLRVNEQSDVVLPTAVRSKG
jgi:hypothetical protein